MFSLTLITLALVQLICVYTAQNIYFCQKYYFYNFTRDPECENHIMYYRKNIEPIINSLVIKAFVITTSLVLVNPINISCYISFLVTFLFTLIIGKTYYCIEPPLYYQLMTTITVLYLGYQMSH